MAVSLRIAGINLVDTATLTASSAVSTLPVDRLATEDIQDYWQATATAAYALADLGASYEVGVLMLINSNAGLTDSVRVRVSTVDATGAAGDAYDSGTILAAVNVLYAKLVHFIEPAVTGRYVRVDLTQPAAPRAGRMLIGKTWTPSQHFSLVTPWEPLFRDWSVRTRSIGLNLFFDRRARQRGLRFTLRGLPGSEVEAEIEALNRINGTSQDVMVCRDSTAADLGQTTIWGVMETTINYPQTEADFYIADFLLWDRV